MVNNVFRTLLCAVMLLFVAAAAAANDIWSALFRETLQLARQGDSEAQYNVGAMYQNGRGVTANRDKAIEWYRKAAEQGNTGAAARLALMKANQASFNSELQQAQQGNAGSQYNMGNMFAKGSGTNIDLGQAIHWYEKAAGQGHPKAAYKLGLAHYEGSGVRKSGKQALKWFRIAAQDGYAPAQYYLGKLYADGNGVSRNDREALDWFTRAVDGGFDQARGEMIDLTERMQMKTASRQPARQEDKPVTAAGQRARGTHAGTGAAAHPVADGGASRVQIMEQLMLGTWNHDEEPVAWLPSSINNCRTEAERIVCFSDDQVREAGTNTIKFKTKAIISEFTNAGSFNVIYRNLVINAVANEAAAQNTVYAFDEAVEHKGFAVNTGWGKEHTLECRLAESTAIECTKNRIQSMVITSQQQVAGRR